MVVYNRPVFLQVWSVLFYSLFSGLMRLSGRLIGWQVPPENMITVYKKGSDCDKTYKEKTKTNSRWMEPQSRLRVGEGR